MTILRYLKRFFLCAVFAVTIVACTKMNDTYSVFVQGGEIYYPGKADSLKVSPGNNRIQLTWLLIADPKITKSIIFWNNKSDSMVFPVTRSSGTDTIKALLPLPEGTYSFEVFTYDAKGNRSVPVSAIGNVYGSNYSLTLVNRTIRTAAMFNPALGATYISRGTRDSALVDFYPASQGHIGMNVRYKNAVGDSVFRFIPASTIKDTLYKFKTGNSIIYRSLYKPEPNSIDTFFSNYETRVIN